MPTLKGKYLHFMCEINLLWRMVGFTSRKDINSANLEWRGKGANKT